MLLPGAPPSFIITTIRGGPFFTDHLKVRVLSYFCFNNLRGKAMANYPQELAQDAVCQSHTGHMTGLWFLPTRPLRLNTNEWMNEPDTSNHPNITIPSVRLPPILFPRVTVVCYCVISVTSHHLVTEITLSRVTVALPAVLATQFCSWSNRRSVWFWQ